MQTLTAPPDDSEGCWALRAEFYTSGGTLLSYPNARNRPAAILRQVGEEP